MFRENLGTKFFALFLAALIWVQIQFSSEHRSIINIPVSLKNVPENLTLDKLPHSIPFYVKGKGLELTKLELSKARVILDASKLHPGVGLISLTDYNIDLPATIDANIIGPVERQDLSINAEEFHQKLVPVKLSFDNQLLQQQTERGELQIIPDKVILFGPKSKVRRINRITTENIHADMIKQGSFFVKLTAPGDDVSASESQVRVKFSQSNTIQRVIDGIALNSSSGLNYFPHLVAVKVSGPAEMINNLHKESIVATPSLEADANGMYTVSVSVPDGIQILGITPNRVSKKN